MDISTLDDRVKPLKIGPIYMRHLIVAIGLVVLLYGALLGWLAYQNPSETLKNTHHLPVGQAVILSAEKTGENRHIQDPPPVTSSNDTAVEPRHSVDNGINTTQPIKNSPNHDEMSSDQTGHPDPDTTLSPIKNKSRHDYINMPAYSLETIDISSDKIDEITEQTKLGPLPIISKSGLKAWKLNARPFDHRDPRPRIVLVLTNMGLNSKITKQAISELPGEISLAFSPYSPDLQSWIDLAHKYGHEVLINLPMEPVTYPLDDPGPHTLLTDVDDKINLERLRWVMSRATGYVGLANFMGSRFTENQGQLQPVFKELSERGLFFLDNNTAGNSQTHIVALRYRLPHSINRVVLDDIPDPERIDEMLSEVTRIARKTGVAVAMANGYPVTIKVLKEWIETLQPRGYVLAPVTASILLDIGKGEYHAPDH